MYLPLVSYRGNAERRETIHRCLYCKKEFNNYRALGGHCRVHRKEIISRIHNYPRLSGNLVAIASTNFYPIVLGHPENANGAFRKLLPLFDIETYPWGFSKAFCFCVTAMGNPIKFFGCNLANPKSQFFASSNLSTRGQSCEIQPPNCSSATVPILPNISETRSFNAFSSLAATGFTFNHSLSSGTNKALQFGTVESTCGDGTPISGNMLPFPSAPTDSLLVLTPIQLYGIKESTIGPGSFLGGLYQRPVQVDIGQSNKRNLLGLEGNMRSHLGAVPFGGNEMNTSKRLKTNPCLSVQTKEPPKELHLFKDGQASVSGLGDSVSEVEGQEDLDLSLRL